MRIGKKSIIGAAITGTVLAAAAGVFAMLRDGSYDSSFDTKVARPRYLVTSPLVLYDEGHLNTHSADAGVQAVCGTHS